MVFVPFSMYFIKRYRGGENRTPRHRLLHVHNHRQDHGFTLGFAIQIFGQIVLDVGTGTGSDGKMHGDLDIEEIRESGAITDMTYTPVPGGIGRVTTAILLRNIIKAAEKES